MILRNDGSVALDKITHACQVAADHYQKFADSVDSDDLSNMFRRLAAMHRGQVACLDSLVRGMGELPSRPDPDLETLQRLGVWLRAAMADRERDVLLHKAEDLERDVKNAIEEALRHELPDGEISIINEMHANAGAALAQFSRALRK
ncbi:hypothetical protein Tel_04290 [Candidatus Tenderia electrophaga]|jgi:uncharacterized protein (TIGR02284 family)|uniref:DUF2383 domain-containing protein n=1 Tax=Candidatus Tenderia electrophaga TaxID=1748243 RepID=A0A0S2TB92_9GAMM|nr:hypothetical protein Tel_04290 [Candidatus Tenderia electrophaga]